MVEIQRDVIAIDVCELDPHGHTSLYTTKEAGFSQSSNKLPEIPSVNVIYP